MGVHSLWALLLTPHCNACLRTITRDLKPPELLVSPEVGSPVVEPADAGKRTPCDKARAWLPSDVSRAGGGA